MYRTLFHFCPQTYIFPDKKLCFWNEGYESSEIILHKPKRETQAKKSPEQNKEPLVPEKKNILPKIESPNIPERPADAKGAKALLEEIKDFPIDKQIAFLAKEAIRGNVPSFMRIFREVTLTDGTTSITIRVCPQYLAVGNDNDYTFLPGNFVAAQKVLKAFNCSLPTTAVVDTIESQADIIAFLSASEFTKDIIDPKTGKPLVFRWHQDEKYRERWMQSTAMYSKTSERVGQLIKEHPQDLTAGYMKDLVYDPSTPQGMETIYGGKYINNKQVQPKSHAHNKIYGDYSHGIRPVDNEVTVTEMVVNKSTGKKEVMAFTMSYKEARKKYAKIFLSTKVSGEKEKIPLS